MALPAGGGSTSVHHLDQHRNLEFLNMAKRMNPRQARWSLFFNRFNFSLTYTLGSKNVKSDALSRLTVSKRQQPFFYSTSQYSDCCYPVGQCQHGRRNSQKLSAGMPTNYLFVPEAVHPQFLEWADASPLDYHPWVKHSLALLNCHFWWLSAKKDTTELIAACLEYVWKKASNQRPQGLLQPLSSSVVPGLLSHYTSSLVYPSLRGCQWSWPLSTAFRSLCSSKETAELLFLHIFRLHGLLLEVISDRGLQFSSYFWKAYCSLIGAKAQLSSGFHPKINGQTKRLNQELKNTLCSWFDSLQVDYAHNSLPVSSTGLLPCIN